MDDALLAGYPRVSIIHGKGTGALRKGVQEFVKQHPRISDSRPGSSGEGGSGVTVIRLKQGKTRGDCDGDWSSLLGKYCCTDCRQVQCGYSMYPCVFSYIRNRHIV